MIPTRNTFCIADRQPSDVNPELTFGLVIAWSPTEPHRVGEIAFFPTLEERIVGRGDEGPGQFALFARQRPGAPISADPEAAHVAGSTIPRRQLVVRATSVDLEVEQIGRCQTFINGEERRRARLKPGDTVLLRGALLLVCVRRPMVLSTHVRQSLHAFGTPDAIGMIGESWASWQLREDIAVTAAGDDHVLVQGETGTGKEMVCVALHDQSKRASKPLIKHSGPCLAYPKLRFFGNLADHPEPTMPGCEGLFTSSEGGTLFVNHIAYAALDAQTVLHETLTRGQYQVYGEPSPRRLDVRVIGAMSPDNAPPKPELLVLFRSHVWVPPLRERPEDIPLLVRHLLIAELRACPELYERFFGVEPSGRLEPRISGRLVDYLVRHPLEGNVREIRRLLFEACYSSDGDQVRMPEKWPPGPAGVREVRSAPRTSSSRASAAYTPDSSGPPESASSMPSTQRSADSWVGGGEAPTPTRGTARETNTKSTENAQARIQ